MIWQVFSIFYDFLIGVMFTQNLHIILRWFDYFFKKIQNLLEIITYDVIWIEVFIFVKWQDRICLLVKQWFDKFSLIIFYDFLTGVMLLSKDRQNLLKIISYDFIFVGIQVKDVKGKDLYQV
jgi:hypothetical protein